MSGCLVPCVGSCWSCMRGGRWRVCWWSWAAAGGWTRSDGRTPCGRARRRWPAAAVAGTGAAGWPCGGTSGRTLVWALGTLKQETRITKKYLESAQGCVAGLYWLEPDPNLGLSSDTCHDEKQAVLCLENFSQQIFDHSSYRYELVQFLHY